MNSFPAPPTDPCCLILANPKAGTLATQERRAVMTERFFRRTEPTKHYEAVPISLTILSEAAGEVGLRADVEVVPPLEELGARIDAAAGQGYDTIVAVGGDGTVHNIVQHLVSTPLRLGILPLGTANNFARGLQIPLDIEGAMRVLARGMERCIDVGRIQDEYFIEAVGVGLFADTLWAVGGQEVHRNELLKLMKATLPLFWNPKTRRLNLTLGGKNLEEEAVMVTVSNSRYVGENWAMAPDASLDDGLFDIVSVGPMDRWHLMQFCLALLRGTHLTLPQVQMQRASRVEIRAVKSGGAEQPVHADDHILATLPVSMTLLPKSLRVLAPPLPKNQSV